MTDRPPQDWTSRARAEGLNPAEVRLVLGRYQAYRRYYETGRRGEPLSLEAWFNWYHAETLSEHGPQAPPPSGCSVDDDASNRGAIRKPAAFLRSLAALAAIEAVK